LDSVRRKPNETLLDTKIATAIENPNGRLDEEKQKLLAAVVKLPKAEKQVVMLHYFSENSVNEVAEILRRKVGTVTKQLSRARIRLRKTLERSKK
jgi:RNA polymerase sigma factor (sigma-70 family)